MSGRPEGDDGWGVTADYDTYSQSVDPDFQPFRSGDARPRSSFVDDLKSVARSFVEPPPRVDLDDHRRDDRRLQEGDRVRSTTTLGGLIGSAVPTNTEGKVVGYQHGLLGDKVTIEFINGYTETVARDAVRYESGWY